MSARAGSAWIDPAGVYRYRLTRCWDVSGTTLAWVMLNPSTADGSADDATIRRVIGFSRSWGHGRVEVVNLFALRVPRPADLAYSHSPVGAENDSAIVETVTRADEVVAAWGNHGALPNPATGVPRFEEVLDLVGAGQMGCLGVTRLGQPRHPLYVRNDLRPSQLSRPRP